MAASAVSSDVTGLLQNDLSSMNASLGAFSTQLSQQQAELATVAALKQRFITESQNGTANEQVCSDADIQVPAEGLWTVAHAHRAMELLRDLQMHLDHAQAQRRHPQRPTPTVHTPLLRGRSAHGLDTAGGH